MALPTRRFGRTELEIPLLSLGGMRFQQSWTDLPADEITSASQTQLEATLKRAVDLGFHHVETARHYGSSERQLGWALPRTPDPSRLLQSKVPPRPDADAFEAELELSFERLGCDRLDLLAIHGINLPEHLEQTLQPGGCMEVVRRWQAEGRIGHVGFSTHGPTALIAQACDSGAFDYVNLHWYYIRQDNGPALDAARRQDMGVFIISPTDKGGHLHTPSQRLLELCAPLHPIVFNDLFCLQDPRVHTISVGAARPEDLELHLEALRLLPEAASLIAPVDQRLRQAADEALGLTGWPPGPSGCRLGMRRLGKSTCRCCFGCTTCWRPGISRVMPRPAMGCWAPAATGLPGPMPMALMRRSVPKSCRASCRRARGVSTSQRFCAASSSGSRANPRCACRASERSS